MKEQNSRTNSPNENKDRDQQTICKAKMDNVDILEGFMKQSRVRSKLFRKFRKWDQILSWALPSNLNLSLNYNGPSAQLTSKKVPLGHNLHLLSLGDHKKSNSKSRLVSLGSFDIKISIIKTYLF